MKNETKEVKNKNYKKKERLNKKKSNNKNRKAKEILEKNVISAQQKTEQDEKPVFSTPRKIINIVKNTVCWVVIAALALTLISFMVVRINGGTPTIFGYSIQRVSSGSMKPTLAVGDIILSKDVSSPDEVKVDDIITFKGGEYYDYKNVTHRVIVAPHMVTSDEYYLTTKGDANDAADDEISFDYVLSKYIVKLDFLNKFYEFFLSPWGLIIFVGALLLIFFDELLNVVKILSGNYKDEDEEESIGDIIKRLKREEEEEKIRQEKEAERKRKRRKKYDNKSVKKKKKQKSLEEKSKAKEESANE